MRKRLGAVALCLLMSVCGSFAACDNDSSGKGTNPPYSGYDAYTEAMAPDDVRYAERVITESDYTFDVNMKNAAVEDLVANPVFASGMVLQRRAVNKLCGYTTAEHIAVVYRRKTYYGTIENNKWEVYLPAMEATDDGYQLTIYTDKGKLALKDVYVGEVFICGGQSNMHLTLSQFGDYNPAHAADAAAANDEKLRLFDVARTESLTPIDQYAGIVAWNAANPSSAGSFSAVGYLYGKRLREVLKVPVGLIATAVGGSGIVYWLPGETYEQLAEQDVDMIASSGVNALTPSFGFNSIINPIRFLKVRGVVWYQGESDAMQGDLAAIDYEKTLRAMADGWRKTFDTPTMIFTVIELPRWDGKLNLAGKDNGGVYKNVRTAQQNYAKNDPLGCMSVSIDLGEYKIDGKGESLLGSIHPLDKSEISLRAANCTLHNFFGVEQRLGPTIEKIERKGDTYRITLKNYGEGMEIRNDGIGFELELDEIDFTEDYEVNLEGKNVVVVSWEKGLNVTGIRYGVHPTTNVENQTDVSKQVSIYNSDGKPMDQFDLSTAED